LEDFIHFVKDTIKQLIIINSS